MPVTIKVNGTVNSLVHKMSNGISTATIPDVCKTPSPGGPIPTPYPNIAQSITLSDGTTTVKGDKMMAAIKGSKFALSNGDNAGVAGGVKSNVFMKEATWILYSFDTKLQKKNAARLSDKMFHNAENAANLTGEIQKVAKALGISEEDAKAICDAICEAKKNKTYTKGVTEKFSDQRYSRANVQKRSSQIWPEVPFKVPSRKGGAFEMIKDGTVKAGRFFAPATTKPKGSVIWDLVVVDGRGHPKKFVEIKFDYGPRPKNFPKHRQWRHRDNWTPNQRKAATKIAKKDRGKIKLLTPKHCGC